MSKRLFALLAAVLIAALVVPALPVRAQDGGVALPNPAACTPEELQQINDIVLDVSQKFATAASTVVPETAEDYVTLALAMSELRNYFDGDDVEMPFCTDSQIVGSTVEFLIDNYVLEMQQSALYFYATEAGDAELADKLMEYGTFHIEKVAYYQEMFGQVIDVLGAGTALLPEWFPACTEDDYSNEAYLQLIDVETAVFEDQRAVLDGFIADSPVSSDMLYTIEDVLVSWETLTEDMPACGDIFWRELLSGVIYYEISMAYHWDAVAAYAEGDLNEAVLAARAEAAEALTEELEDWEMLFPEAETEE